MSKLWAIHIPGPDDIYAAPSEDAAKHMAEKHNAAMREYFEKHPERTGGDWPAVESVMARVIEWPFEDGHAEDLKDFDAADWGWKDGAT